MNNPSDTIAAIATAVGQAGISIVRISGSEALSIADRVFAGHGAPPSQQLAGQFLYGQVCEKSPHGQAQIIDEVILLIFRAPHSYTCEDVVEIQGHGGLCARRILRSVLTAGAKMAEPGEFTRRAFLNGRIDLLQAEAVADLIRAQSDHSAILAMDQLSGSLTSSFSNIYDDLVALCANLDATLDFPEEDFPKEIVLQTSAGISRIIAQLKQQLSTGSQGHLLREGASVVIAGQPNVGKSTLLNLLLGKRRAIVAETPGTTRDTIEESIVLEGIPVRLMDTAGLREVECHIEKEGIERARDSQNKADLILYLIDASQDTSAKDMVNCQAFGTKKTIILLNKTDMGNRTRISDFESFSSLSVCLLNDRDLPDIRKTISEKLDLASLDQHPAAISERHSNIIQIALNELNDAQAIVNERLDKDIVIVSTLLHSALEYIGTITGKVYNDDILKSVFSRFCIGK